MTGTEVELLQRLADQQQRQIEIAEEALALQKRQAERLELQIERADRIQSRAESMQARASRVARIAVYVLVPLIVFLCAVLLTPYFRYWFWLARH